MFTDEELICELEAAFRDETAGLTYAGKVPVPGRAPLPWTAVPWTALPIAAATAAVIVLPQLGGAVTTTPAPPRATETARTQVDGTFGPVTGGPATQDHVKMVTASFELAGRTFHYQRPADEPQRYILTRLSVELPDGVTPVDDPYDLEKAWSGKDPKTGDAAVWLQDSRYFHNQYVEMTSPSFSVQELVTMLQTPPDQQKPF